MRACYLQSLLCGHYTLHHPRAKPSSVKINGPLCYIQPGQKLTELRGLPSGPGEAVSASSWDSRFGGKKEVVLGETTRLFNVDDPL